MAYAIQTGWNVADLDLDTVKSFMRHDPLPDRVPLGSVTKTTLNGAVQFNGRVQIKWRWDAITREDVDALLNYLGVDVTVGSAQVTIKTTNFQDVEKRYNAYMINPQPQENWTRIAGGNGAVRDFEVFFNIIEEL